MNFKQHFSAFITTALRHWLTKRGSRKHFILFKLLNSPRQQMIWASPQSVMPLLCHLSDVTLLLVLPKEKRPSPINICFTKENPVRIRRDWVLGLLFSFMEDINLFSSRHCAIPLNQHILFISLFLFFFSFFFPLESFTYFKVKQT